MEQKTDRLVDYFSVIGLGKQLQSDNPEKDTGQSITMHSILNLNDVEL